jgi:hypothetical protein
MTTTTEIRKTDLTVSNEPMDEIPLTQIEEPKTPPPRVEKKSTPKPPNIKEQHRKAKKRVVQDEEDLEEGDWIDDDGSVDSLPRDGEVDDDYENGSDNDSVQEIVTTRNTRSQAMKELEEKVVKESKKLATRMFSEFADAIKEEFQGRAKKFVKTLFNEMASEARITSKPL